MKRKMKCLWCRYWYGRKTFLDEWTGTELFRVGMWIVRLEVGRRKLFWTKFTGNEKYLVIMKPADFWTCVYIGCKSTDVWTGNSAEEIIEMLKEKADNYKLGIKD